MANIEAQKQSLKYLSCVYNIFGGVLAVIFIGLLFLFSSIVWELSQANAPGAIIVGLVYILILTLYVMFTIGMLLTGRCLREFRNLAFIRKMAFVECVLFPLGTILGIVTLITISQETVKGIFNSHADAPPPLPEEEAQAESYDY